MKSSVSSKFTVIRDMSRCTQCQTCVAECAFDANYFDALEGVVKTRQFNCVGCENCMIYCPAKALKVLGRGAPAKRKGSQVKHTAGMTMSGGRR